MGVLFCGIAYQGMRPTRGVLGANQLERRAHFAIGAAPGELSGQSPEIDAILAVKSIDPKTVLLDMVMAAEAYTERIMRL